MFELIILFFVVLLFKIAFLQKLKNNNKMRNINKIINIFDLYYSKKITREERLTMLKNSISVEDFNEAILLLEDDKSLEDVQNVILTGWLLNCFNPSNEKPLRRLLLLNFHNSHEDIVDLFQTMWNNNSENIPILLKAIDNIPKYLELEDFKYPYIRKIIYAIGAQPQPESLLALEKLVSETNDTEIKKLALHQLEKRKELGR